MQHQLSLPGSLHDVTPDWLTGIFRANAILPTGSVESIETSIIGEERGFTGVVARVQLQYRDCVDSAPSSVVVKLPLARRETPSAYRASLDKDNMAARRYAERCAREVLFYQQIAPQVALSVPQLYYGAADIEAGRAILVLEDLQHARQGDALEGCSAQDAALVIEQLARLHAQWWEHPHLATFSWLPLWGGNAQEAQARYIHCLEPFLQRFGSRVPAEIQTCLTALTTQYGSIRERLQQRPNTLVHADLHLDNLLFSPFDAQPDVTVIDWQNVARGRGVIDLALFLFGSLTTPTRRAVETDLLHRYHESLLAGGIREYSYNQLLEDCRLVLLWLLGARVVSLGSLDLESLGGRELALVNESLTEDSFAAFLDYNAQSLLSL
ncbi:phosphotransferase [Dictyobacter aurantiacus]|uniref:Aminoglycoside phosphotransferase n=1 Tax=Dictyobacter aurantiacus TaxID=1936993 RepID=A0A401ZK53_9CHLR|nr:phosphotransferase [Dictyobacter aurantiacus]GCE07247.1 aminoglycoside phosphotransferase [Dictyobacter aurantiacus]